MSSLYLDCGFRDIVKYYATWCKIHLCVRRWGGRLVSLWVYSENEKVVCMKDISVSFKESDESRG